MHSLQGIADVDERLGPGGAIEAFVEAKAQGLGGSAILLALQNTTDRTPAGARSYEPAALVTHATGAAIEHLLKFYELTGESKYLAPIPAALAWLEDAAQEVDLLLTDQTMPQLTGLQLARRAHALRPGLPVLLVSGNAQALDSGELQASGIAGTLPKPVDAARLRSLLEELLAPPVR